MNSKHMTMPSFSCLLTSLLLIASISGVVNAQAIQFTYDLVDRLTEVRYSTEIIRYTYDASGNRTGTTVELLTTTPSVSEIIPSVGSVGGSGFTLSVNGSNFTNSSIVQWNGFNRPTTFVNANQLTAVISSGDISAIGTVPVTVINQTTNAVSNSQIFTVQAGGSCIPVAFPTGLTVPINSSISIPVTVPDITGRGIDSFDFVAAFDPAVLQLNSVAPVDTSGTLSGGFTITANTSVPGRITVGGFGTSSLAGQGTLIKLNFNVIGAHGSNSALSWSVFRFNEGEPCSTPANGSVTVSGVSNTISGTITYANTPAGQQARFVPGVLLSAAGTPQGSATSNSSGLYSIMGLGSGPYTVTPSKSGDVNGISSLDAARVAQHVAGLIALTPNQQVAGDATNNGSLSSLDAARIAQTAAGIANPGIAGQWKFSPASRTYASLPGSTANENYGAILVGDVTGNWTAPTQPVAELDKGSDRKLAALAAETESTASGVPVSLPANAWGGLSATVTIPVTIGDTTGRGIVAYDFVLAFDQSVLVPAATPVTTTGTMSNGWTITPNTGTPGQITVSGFNTTALTGSGALLNLHFNVVGADGAISPLTWNSMALNEGEVPAKTTNGSFVVIGPTAAHVSVSGRVTSVDGSGINGAIVTVAGPSGQVHTARTNPFGYYRVEGLEAGQTYTITPRSKRYAFDPPSIVRTVLEELTDVNFVGREP